MLHVLSIVSIDQFVVTAGNLAIVQGSRSAVQIETHSLVGNEF